MTSFTPPELLFSAFAVLKINFFSAREYKIPAKISTMADHDSVFLEEITLPYHDVEYLTLTLLIGSAMPAP